MNISSRCGVVRVLSICLCFLSAWTSASVLAKPQIMEKQLRNPYQETLLRYKAMQKQAAKSSSALAVKPRIVGGIDAKPNAYPWMTALLIAEIPDAQYAQFCGGSLVAPDIVVTAAHCVDGLPGSDFVEVVVGANDLRSVTPAQRIKILGYAVHPGWDAANILNDIAIIKLSQAIDNPTLPIIDPLQMDSLLPGDLVTAIGFGVLNDTTFTTPDVLQEVQLALWDHTACNDAFAFLGGINETHLCAGSPNNGIQDSCYGDSGGPLMANIAGEWRLTGIVSWGIGCGLPDYPGVYTKASLYGDWVTSASTSLNIDALSFFDFVGVGEERVLLKTVQNWGSQARTISSISIDDPSLGFSISETDCLNKVLAPSEICHLEITFKPLSEGYKDAHLLVTASDGASTSSHLFGIGLAEVNAGTALDNKELNWYSGVDAYWSEVSMSDAVAGSAMQAGNITNMQYTAIHTHVEGPGTITYNWKVSAEDYFDYLFLVVDGYIVDAITGDTPWSQGSYAITGAGTHAVSWIYYKDSIISMYQDTAWLDAVTWTPNIAQAQNLNAFGSVGTGNESSGGSGGGSLNWLLLLGMLFPLLRRKIWQ